MALPALASLLLGLFASVLLASHPPSPPRPPGDARGVWPILATFAGGVAIALWLRPQPAALALYAGCAAALSLLAAPAAWVRPALAGFGAGLTAAAIFPAGQTGSIAVLVWLAALGAVLASARLAARGAGFAPRALRDQGECAIVIAAPVAAALPGAAAGWQSALALSGTQVSVDAASPGLWLLVPLLALIGGILHQLWWRRR